MSKFSDTYDGFSIEYPSDWYMNTTDSIPDDDWDELVLIMPYEEYFDPYPEYIQVYRDNSIINNMNLTGYLQQQIVLASYITNFQIIDTSTDEILGNTSAYSLTYSYDFEQGLGLAPLKIKNYEIGIIVNNIPYSIVYSADERQYDRYLPYMQSIIDSFQLLNQGGGKDIVPDDLLNKANEFYLSSRYEEAIQHYLELLKTEPTNIIVLHNIVGALLKQGKYEETLPHIDKILSIDPTDSFAIEKKMAIQNVLRPLAIAQNAENSTNTSRDEDRFNPIQDFNNITSQDPSNLDDTADIKDKNNKATTPFITNQSLRVLTNVPTIIDLYNSTIYNIRPNLMLEIVEEPTFGNLSEIFNGNSTVVYTPAQGYTGIDHFTYRIIDENGFYSNEARTELVVISKSPRDKLSESQNTTIKYDGCIQDQKIITFEDIYVKDFHKSLFYYCGD